MNSKRLFLLILFVNMENFCMNNSALSNEKEDIYPMPIFCTLTVDDVQKSADWYSKALNFKVIFALNNPETKELNFVHLRRKKYQDILLVQGKTNRDQNVYGIAITFQAWTDIDLLVTQAKENKAVIVIEPHNTLWNTREVAFQDLDGYRINFTHVRQVNKNLEIFNTSWNK